MVVDRWVVGDLRGAAVAMAAGGRGDSGGSYKNKQLHTHLPHRSRCGGVLPEPAEVAVSSGRGGWWYDSGGRAVAVATRAAVVAAAVMSVPVSLTARTAEMWLVMIYGRSHARWSW